MTDRFDTRCLSCLPPEPGQGRSDGKIRDGGSPSRPSSDFETARSSEYKTDYTQWRTDHFDTKSDQFGIGGGTTMEETQSSPTVKLAGQTLQRQSSEDAAPMHGLLCHPSRCQTYC